MPTSTENQPETAVSAPPSQFRSFIGTRRTENPPAVAADGGQELADVRKLLKAQEIARQRAQGNTIEAQQKLKTFETETNRVRDDLKRVKAQLADAKEEHTGALRRATEREAGLWNQLAAVRVQATKATDKASGYRKLAVFSLVLLMPVMSWATVKYWPTTVAGDKTRTETSRIELAALPVAVANAAPHDFTSETQRLDQALDYFGNQSAEDVLRKVHDANAARGVSVCSFEWNGGQVSLLFGEKAGAGLGASMTQCADAVEQAAKKLGK